MEKKEMLLALIEGLKEELAKRTEKLMTILKSDFSIEVQEELNRLTVELNNEIETFKAKLESDKRATADNINLDICAINRIITDKTKELAEIETAELANAETIATEENVATDSIQ